MPSRSPYRSSPLGEFFILLAAALVLYLAWLAFVAPTPSVLQ